MINIHGMETKKNRCALFALFLSLADFHSEIEMFDGFGVNRAENVSAEADFRSIGKLTFNFI